MEHENRRLEDLREVLWNDYAVVVQHEEAYWFHQAKSKWVMLGDKNTRFFHQATISRRRHNRIAALLNNDNNWVYDDQQLLDMVVAFYQGLYASSLPADSSFPCSISFLSIKEDDLARLQDPISMVETRSALFSMGNFKSPGPDGYHPMFFKSQWETVGPSIFQFVQLVFADPSNIQVVNQTNISLIPIKEEPSKITEFRSIALCNVIYKVVTKIIANRLRPTLCYMVSQQQSSFTPCRSTVDNILLLQETIHSMSLMKGQKGFMVLKLHLDKAYDRLEWDFVRSTLHDYGLPPNLI